MDPSSDVPATVVDDGGRIHHLVGAPIAGGQGRVFNTREPAVGVKLLTHGAEASETIQRVRRLHTEDLPFVVAPMSVLRDVPGYVMLWLGGMTPIKSLLPQGSDYANVVDWFVRTGSVRRRLAVCARLADAIAELHSRGLIYCDLNLGNVMVSAAPSASEVRLIDLDNLILADDRPSRVRTELWAAPEVNISGAHSTTADAYSLALVTFGVLTGYHPFLAGDAVRPTPPKSPEWVAALRGELPSVVDERDTSNSTDRLLLDLEFLISPGLLRLFRRSFGDGRRSPRLRTTAAQWRRGLWAAHDATVECDCGFSTYLTHDPCPCCDTPRSGINRALISSAAALPPVADLAVGNKPVPLRNLHLPVPCEPGRRYDEVASLTSAGNAVQLSTSPGWTASSASIAPGSYVLLTGPGGHSVTLTVVPSAN